MLLYFENGVRWAKCLVAGAPGADQGDGQIPETGGAPEALVGNTSTPKTEAGVLEAKPGGLTLVFMADLYSRRMQSVYSCFAACIHVHIGKLSTAGCYIQPHIFFCAVFDND